MEYVLPVFLRTGSGYQLNIDARVHQYPSEFVEQSFLLVFVAEQLLDVLLCEAALVVDLGVECLTLLDHSPYLLLVLLVDDGGVSHREFVHFLCDPELLAEVLKLRRGFHR